jgi:hypothetical protein
MPFNDVSAGQPLFSAVSSKHPKPGQKIELYYDI